VSVHNVALIFAQLVADWTPLHVPFQWQPLCDAHDTSLACELHELEMPSHVLVV
jgi:hypothetical protein